MTVARLTDAIIDQLSCPPGRKHWEVFDTVLRGLYIDVLASGRKAWRLYYRQNGRKRYITLGDAAVFTLAEAREKARQMLRKIAFGADPHAVLLPGAGPTVEAFLLQQYLPFVRTYKRSWACDESLIRVQVLPLLGPSPMGELIPPDIARLVDALKARGYAAGTINRVLVMLRYAWRLALRWKVEGVSENPLDQVKNLVNDNKVERFLSHVDAQRLQEIVQRSRNPVLESIVALLIYTGARKREVLDARWEDFDLRRKAWRIPRTKSGKVRHVPLSQAAMALLESLRRASPEAQPQDYVFPNPRTGKPFGQVFNSWNSARRKAGMPRLRLHDLRHSFASFLVNAGCSLYEVQKILGHASINMTQRHSHLNQESLLRAVSHAGHIVAPSQNHKFAPPNTSIVPSGRM